MKGQLREAIRTREQSRGCEDIVPHPHSSPYLNPKPSKRCWIVSSFPLSSAQGNDNGVTYGYVENKRELRASRSRISQASYQSRRQGWQGRDYHPTRSILA